MREFLGNFFLKVAEFFFGRSACRIYSRKPYPGYRVDGKRWNSPFLTRETVQVYQHHFIVPNAYPYKGFDEHFLIVPKREVQGIVDMTSEEQGELIYIIAEWEHKGYIILSQEFWANPASSIFHKHVHLLRDSSVYKK